MKSFFERTGGTYRRVGDYYIPNLVLGEEFDYHIGRYGLMHKKYLEETNSILYASMALSGRLWAYLAEIDQNCNERMDRLIGQMKEREGVTEALKAAEPMRWVGAMNNIRNRAEEIVLREVVYA